MMNIDEYWRIEAQYTKSGVAVKALENDKAVVVYWTGSEKYEAIQKEVSGHEYSRCGQYHKSTKGDFKRAKRAFEKYSGIEQGF